MRQKLISTFIAITAMALMTACGNSELPPSPLEGRGKISGSSLNGSNVGQSGNSSGAGAITGAQGGKLSVSSVSVTSSGTSLAATYVNPSYGVNLTISAHSISSNQDFSADGYNNKGNNYSYYYAEGRCQSNSGTSCDVAYYAIYIVDYDQNGSYMKISNFGVVKNLNGTTYAFPVNKTDTYLSVDELVQMYSTPYP